MFNTIQFNIIAPGGTSKSLTIAKTAEKKIILTEEPIFEDEKPRDTTGEVIELPTFTFNTSYEMRYDKDLALTEVVTLTTRGNYFPLFPSSFFFFIFNDICFFLFLI